MSFNLNITVSDKSYARLRKVLWFTGFHSNVGKTFASLVSSKFKVLKKAISQKVHQENFRVLVKIVKLFSHLTYVVYGILQ